MKKITIKDIAEEAGVSKATVSRVLNHEEAVDAVTREHVLAVIKKRRYAPSIVAQTLSRQHSSTIGVIIPEIDNVFFGGILKGIAEVVDDNKLTLLYSDTNNESRKDLNALQMLCAHLVQGIIYTPSLEHGEEQERREVEKLIRDIAIPIVLLDRDMPSMSLDGVFFDNYGGGYEAAKVLIKAGHRNIAIINGSSKLGIARERGRGYREALEEHGIEVQPRYSFEGDYTVPTAYELSKKLLEMDGPPTAVLTCNNNTGLGFLKALTEKGMSIPSDMECVGIDDIEAVDFLGINYSYVARNTKKMGRMAMELLLRRIHNPLKSVEKLSIPPKLVLKGALRELTE